MGRARPAPSASSHRETHLCRARPSKTSAHSSVATTPPRWSEKGSSPVVSRHQPEAARVSPRLQIRRRYVRRITGRPGSAGTTTWAVTGPFALVRSRNSRRPRVWARSSRALARTTAMRRLDRGLERVERTWRSRSVTFPELTTTSSSARLPARRATRSRRSFNRLTTAPGARTTTTTPSRSRTETRARASGRALRRTSASWSPGSARRGTLAETRSVPAACGASLMRAGRNLSQPAAELGPPRLTMRGRPRKSSARPAEATSTATAFLPGFLSRTRAAPPPWNTIRAGAAVNPRASGRLPAPAAGTSASAKASAQRNVRLIVR